MVKFVPELPEPDLLLQKTGRIGLGFSGCIFNEDRGCDSDESVRPIREYGMKPNIRMRADAVRTKMKRRREAVRTFGPEPYKTRGMMGGIFGAEETGNRRLTCRFIKAPARRRFGLCKAMGRNLEASNRFDCAASLWIPAEAA